MIDICITLCYYYSTSDKHLPVTGLMKSIPGGNTMEEIRAFVRMNGQDIAVKVVNVFSTGDGRRVASVEALPVNGFTPRPFTQYSIGGPSQSSGANIRIEYLRGISRINAPEPQPQPEPKPVIGMIRIDGQDVEIEVTEVYTNTHGERIAGIRALPVNGKRPRPFLNYSSERGNPYTDSTRVPVSDIIGLSLSDIAAG